MSIGFIFGLKVIDHKAKPEVVGLGRVGSTVIIVDLRVDG